MQLDILYKTKKRILGPRYYLFRFEDDVQRSFMKIDEY